MVRFVFYGQVIINCLEINLKVESSRFSLNMTKKKHLNTTILGIHFVHYSTLKQLYSDNLLRHPLRRRS